MAEYMSSELQSANKAYSVSRSGKIICPIFLESGQSSYVVSNLSWPQWSLPDPLVQGFNTHCDGEHFYVDILTDWIGSSDVFIPPFPEDLLLSNPRGNDVGGEHGLVLLTTLLTPGVCRRVPTPTDPPAL